MRRDLRVLLQAVTDSKSRALVLRYSPLVRKFTWSKISYNMKETLRQLDAEYTLFPNLVHATVCMREVSDQWVSLCLPSTLTTLELTCRLTSNKVDNGNNARDMILRRLTGLRKLVFTAERTKPKKGKLPAPLLTLAECIPFDACPKLLELEIRDTLPLVYDAADLAAFCDAHVDLTHVVLNPMPANTTASGDAPGPEVLGVLAEKVSAKLHKLVAFECFLDGGAPVPQERPREPYGYECTALERVSVGATQNGWRLETHVRALAGRKVEFFYDVTRCTFPAM